MQPASESLLLILLKWIQLYDVAAVKICWPQGSARDCFALQMGESDLTAVSDAYQAWVAEATHATFIYPAFQHLLSIHSAGIARLLILIPLDPHPYAYALDLSYSAFVRCLFLSWQCAPNEASNCS